MEDFLRKAATSFSFNAGKKEIVRLCQPFLDTWNFKNFYYVRITRKGEFFYLTNDVGFAMDYWEAGLPLRTGVDKGVEGMLSFPLLWDQALEQEILDFAKVQNCFDGFSLVNRYYDTIQFASFLRSSSLDSPSLFYMKHQDVLRCWLREFEWKNRHLLSQAEQRPMVLPKDYLSPQEKAFYPERTVKLGYRNIKAKISFRELDCLCLYSKGFTTSRIALLLGLSPRTIETHLESIKNRFGLSSRNELAELSYANPVIQSYAPRLSHLP